MRSLALLVLLTSTAVADPQRCVVEKVAARSAAKRKAPACHRPPKAMAQAITAEIAKEFTPEHGGRVDVTFPCDGLGPKIREIVVETGSGHGGSLELWRARRRDDGRYDVRGIVYGGNSMTHAAASPPHEQASGVVALPELDTARAATVAKIKEIVPPPRSPGSVLGMSGSWSSNDFHLLVRFVDDEGRVVERKYTGYESSMNQGDYLGLQVTATALAPMTSLAPHTNPPDAEDQALFVERFNAAVPHFDEDFYWWMMERYVDLARTIGTPKTLAGLLTRLDIPARANRSNRSKVEARSGAVDAIAKITGWDARAGGRSVEEAAAAYLAECH